MIAAQIQSPIHNGVAKFRPKSDRKPLQPRNANSPVFTQRPRQELLEISLVTNDCNKENHTNLIYINKSPAKLEKIDSSLAEELSAVKKRLERLRLDKEKTEKMLNERGMALEKVFNEIEQRGEVQRRMEMEVDRLYRLKQIRSRCMSFSPIRSLREREQAKTNNLALVESEINSKKIEMEGLKDEGSAMQSPGSASSKIVADKS